MRAVVFANHNGPSPKVLGMRVTDLGKGHRAPLRGLGVPLVLIHGRFRVAELLFMIDSCMTSCIVYMGS